jgi:hypothetical protein
VIISSLSKLAKALSKNTNNSKLAWHLFKCNLLSSPTSSSSHHCLIPTRHRLLACIRIHVQMHCKMDSLPELLFATQPIKISHPYLVSLVQVLPSSSSPRSPSKFLTLVSFPSSKFWSSHVSSMRSFPSSNPSELGYQKSFVRYFCTKGRPRRFCDMVV